MRYRVLESVAVALAFAAAAVPLAHASGSDAGSKSDYPNSSATRRTSTTVTSRVTRNSTPSTRTRRRPRAQRAQTTATSPGTPPAHKPHRSRVPTAPSTGATRPSAPEQQPWRSSWRLPAPSCSAAATTGSPSESSEPASSPVSPIYAPPQLDEMRRSAADADAVCERRDRLEVAQVVRTCALLYDRAWARRSRRSVTGGPQARATSGVARGISNGANEWFSVASRGASVDRLAPGRAPGLTRRS